MFVFENIEFSNFDSYPNLEITYTTAKIIIIQFTYHRNRNRILYITGRKRIANKYNIEMARETELSTLATETERTFFRRCTRCCKMK